MQITITDELLELKAIGKITPTECLLLGLIHELTPNRIPGKPYFSFIESNQVLCDELGLKERQVQKMLARLVKEKLLIREFIRGKRITRFLWINY